MSEAGGLPEDATLATGGGDVDTGDGRGEARPALIDAGHADAGGRSEGGRLLFIADGLEMGRRPQAPPGGGTWYIPDARVSAQHARITRSGKTLHIVDLDSRNGTLVSNRRIDGPTRLVDGDVIMVGRQAAVFRWLTGEHTRAIAQELQQPFGPTCAVAPAMAMLLQRLRLLAPSSEELLLTGETGVGKEVYAQAVHAASGRKGPFVAINCAAIPVELVESELFGHARGAHSQASESRVGLIAKADGGTLFLDEIGDMPSAAQAKLLRFLQTRTFAPLGAAAARTVDVRIIAATTRAAQDGTGGGLRADLAGRLGAEPFVIPPLRQRREDLGALVAYFLAAAAEGSGQAPRGTPRAHKRLEAAALAALLAHDWPQNVRELQKVIRQAVLFADGAEVIRWEHLPMRLRAGQAVPEEGGDSFDEARKLPDAESSRPPRSARGERDARDTSGSQRLAGQRRDRRPMPEREVLVQMLARHRGNVAEVARELDRHWGVVQRALTKHSIDPNTYRVPDE